MTDIREAVARAICETEGHDPNQKCGDNLMWQTYLKSTDAAIAEHIDAIMMPSVAMLEAAMEAMKREDGSATTIWQAMLTAMRNEK